MRNRAAAALTFGPGAGSAPASPRKIGQKFEIAKTLPDNGNCVRLRGEWRSVDLTRLTKRFPWLQGICREFSENRAIPGCRLPCKSAEFRRSTIKFPTLPAGNFLRALGNLTLGSWDGVRGQDGVASAMNFNSMASKTYENMIYAACLAPNKER